MIPLARPDIGEPEERAVLEALRSGRLVQGAQVAAFEALLAARCGRRHAIATSSGTAAVELALRSLGVTSGNVLCPALTWPSPAHAIHLCGARAVLVDVDPHEWNSTAGALSEARTSETRAVIVIDQFGFPARHDDIAAALGDVPIIEDAACAIGASLGGRPAGSMGAVACLSFHPRKIVTTGEGGACLTDDDELADALRALRNHGQAAPGQFARVSGNSRMGELGAALGVAQMGRLDEALAARRRLATRYQEALPGLSWQRPAPGTEPSYQTLGAVLPQDAPPRDQVLADLEQAGVQAGILSYALNRLTPIGDSRAMPITEKLVDRGFALPLYTHMSAAEQNQVISAIGRVVPGAQ